MAAAAHALISRNSRQGAGRTPDPVRVYRPGKKGLKAEALPGFLWVQLSRNSFGCHSNDQNAANDCDFTLLALYKRPESGQEWRAG